MRKTKFLVLALAVAVMLMGSAYAFWNETVTLTSNVSTGQLDIKFLSWDKVKEVKVGGEYVSDTNSRVDVAVSPTSGDNVTDSAVITYTNLYPGAKATAILNYRNNSSMPVKLVNKITTLASHDGLLHPEDVTVTPIINGNEYAYTYVSGPDSNNTGYHTGAQITVNPGDLITFRIVTTVPTSLPNEYENDSATVTFSPEFIQFNEAR